MLECNSARRWSAVFIVSVALCLLVLPAPAAACSCRESTYPCGRFDDLRSTQAPVFTGTVTAVTVEELPAGPSDVRTAVRRVRFAVTESFFGAMEKEVEVSTNASSASCGYGFLPGQSYLVYASRWEGRLTVSLCSRTRPLADAADDVDLLRRWALGSTETRIFGWVTLGTSAGKSLGRQPGLVVVAETDGHVQETVTDARGQFRFRDLPLGKYSLRARLNDKTTADSRFDPVLSEAQLCAEVGFYVMQGPDSDSRRKSPSP